MEFGIAINGILFEPLTGEYWNNDRNSGWNLEWSTNEIGFDFNNAHVQPDGTYHYHGEPTSLLAAVDGNTQTLIGYAADGFPIYVEDLSASYQIKSGEQPDGPGGTYDGTYYYVITESFPIISRCFRGTPNESFVKGPGDIPQGPGGGSLPTGNDNRPPRR